MSTRGYLDEPSYEERSAKKRRGVLASRERKRRGANSERRALKEFKMETFGDDSKKARSLQAVLVRFMQENNIMMLKYDDVNKLYGEQWSLDDIYKLDRSYLEKNRKKSMELIGDHMQILHTKNVIRPQKRGGYTRRLPMDLYPHNIEVLNEGDPRIHVKIRYLEDVLRAKRVPKEVERYKNRRFMAYFEELMARYDPTRPRNTGKFMGAPVGLRDDAYVQARDYQPHTVGRLTSVHDHHNSDQAANKNPFQDIDVTGVYALGFELPLDYYRGHEYWNEVLQQPGREQTRQGNPWRVWGLGFGGTVANYARHGQGDTAQTYTYTAENLINKWENDKRTFLNSSQKSGLTQIIDLMRDEHVKYLAAGGSEQFRENRRKRNRNTPTPSATATGTPTPKRKKPSPTPTGR